MRLIDADALIGDLHNHAFLEGDDRAISYNIIQKQPTVGGWISVEDRLPKKDGQYLCWFGKNTVAIGAAIATYLEEWKAFGSLASLETYPNVTHWMPIEPPKEEEK